MQWRKVWSVASRVITWVLIAFTVTMLAFTIITLAMGRRNATLFGYKAYVVLTDSMSEDPAGGPTFDAGDMIVCREVDPQTLEVGDIISFTCMDPDSEVYGQVITHKIYEKGLDGDVPFFRTYGTTKGTVDEALVYYNHVLGEYSFSIPNLGKFIQWLRTPLGYVLVIGLPFGALIATQSVNVVRAWRALKEHERSELDVEREQLAAEREQMSRMMEELQRMREEMGMMRAGPLSSQPSEQTTSEGDSNEEKPEQNA